MKILFVATVRSHIGQFHIPFIKELKSRGVEVHAAYKDNSADKAGLDLSSVDKVFEVPFERQPLKFQNIKAFFALKKIIDENDYDAIHCHTPMGAVITRLAAMKARKNGTKVIYTAHGFHFFKGASRKNWLFFYPIEKFLSRYTDCLITINQEDFNLANTRGFKAKQIRKIPGVGVELDRFHPVDEDEKMRLREEYGYKQDAFLMIYPANLVHEKNHSMLFDSLRIIVQRADNVKLLLPGQKTCVEEYEQTICKMSLQDHVDFLGYRRDIEKLVALSDISVSPSKREGLPINIVEAMAAGNAVVATDIRGNKDLVEHGVNGYLVKVDDSDGMAECILELYNDRRKLKAFGRKSLKKVSAFSASSVNSTMIDIYREFELL